MILEQFIDVFEAEGFSIHIGNPQTEVSKGGRSYKLATELLEDPGVDPVKIVRMVEQAWRMKDLRGR